MKRLKKGGRLGRALLPTASAFAAVLLSAGFASAINIDVHSTTYDSSNDGPDFPSADLDLDNDFTRIQGAIASASDNDVITLFGTFDWTQTDALADFSNPTGAIIGYTWNEANMWGVRPPTGLDGITLQGDPVDGAEIIGPKDRTDIPNASNPISYTLSKPQTGFLVLGSQTNNNWTIQNLTIRNFGRAISFGTNATTPGWVIQNNEFYIGSWGDGFAAAIHVRSYKASNLLIDSNIFSFIVNSGDYDGPGGPNYGLNAQLQGIRVDCCSTNQFKNATVSNNLFQAVFEDKDGSSVIEPSERIVTSQMFCIDENNNQTQGTLTVDGNIFDGGVDDGNGGTIMAGIEAMRVTQKPDTFTTMAGISNTVYTNNTFREFFVCFYPRVFNPGDNAGTLIIGPGNSFENCGYNDPDNPALLYVLPDKWGTTFGEIAYAAAILNAKGSAYSGSGGSYVVLDLSMEWNGVTGIPMLNDIANDGRCFESIPFNDGTDATAQAGILAARVEPPAATTYNNPAWTFQDRFARPTPEEDAALNDLTAVELALGYNAFGDPIDEGDPNALIVNGDPTTDGDGDNGLLTIYITADTEIPPGTIVDKPTRIIPDPNKAGAPAGAFVLSSTVKKLTSALFSVNAGASLTIEDLILDGNTPFTGPRDMRSVVDMADAGAAVTLQNVTVRNFFGEAVTPRNGSSVLISDSIIEESGGVVKTPVGKSVSDVTVTRSFIRGMYDSPVVPTSGGTYAFSQNVFSDINTISTFYIVGSPTNLTLGTAGAGNLFFDILEFSFNGAPPAPASLDFSNNWHSVFYGEGPTDLDGVIIGNQDATALGAIVGINAGVRTHDYFASQAYVEQNVIAQFDRDLDAWPDAWEVDSAVTSYDVFDSDNDGWPDGIEAARGTNPNNNASFPAGVFDINADVDDNGIADWYEEALLANLGIAPFLGDVLGDDGVAGLQDAVRSLQIVNGAFGAKDLTDGDLNALDVTGLGPSSLGNPLQILRFQAGVRNKLPALAGID